MQYSGLIAFIVLFWARLAGEIRVKPRDTERRAARRGMVSLQLLSQPFLFSGIAVAWWLWRGGIVSAVLYFAGIFLFVIGFMGRVAALKQLGRGYSFYIDPAPTEPLRTEGIYSFIRHPLYAFYILEMSALVLIRPNWISMACLVLVIAATAWRIGREEQALIARYGAEYGNYQKRTKRLVPGIY